MTRKWEVRRVDLVPYKIGGAKRQRLVAEFSQMLYSYICQLYQKLDFSSSVISCGSTLKQGVDHD